MGLRGELLTGVPRRATNQPMTGSGPQSASSASAASAGAGDLNL